MSDKLQEIQKLRELIRHHNYQYYVENTPSITDEEYDLLFDKLSRLENENPDLITPDSPTQRVGAAPQTEFSNVEHRVPMLSLSKVTTKDAFDDFTQRITDNLSKEVSNPNFEYMCEPKLDGLALEIVYENGHLVQASTRGDGFIGEDVTLNVRTIKSIPLVLTDNNYPIPQLIEFRGEAIFLKEDFEKMNEARISQGEEAFANPRNSASGTLRQLDPKITAERPLSAFFYDIGTHIGIEYSSHKEQLDIIKGYGVPVVPYFEKCKTPEDVDVYFKKITEKRSSLPFEIDGVVVKVNRIDYQELLGAVSRSPRWAIAWKFESEQAMTKLLNVVWNVGRTGAVTPVAVLEPVKVGGVVIKSASLHNEDLLKEKDIHIGDNVMVKRAGDVIPYVENSVVELRDGTEKEITPPIHCPSCGTELYKNDEDAFRRCPNRSSCPAQIKESIIHFVSKPAMNIDGIGEKQIEQFLEKGLIKTPADLYTLTREELLPLERMGEKSVTNILNAIESSKNATLDRFINAIGIPGVGTHIAEVITEHYSSLDELAKANEEDLVNINEIGPTIAHNIVEYFTTEENKKLLEKLKILGINPIIAKEEAKSQILKGLSIVVTGTMKTKSRDEVKAIIKELGGTSPGSVSKKTSYVLAGEKAGSKLDKAQSLGVKVISEDDFFEMIKSESNQSDSSDLPQENQEEQQQSLFHYSEEN